MKIHVINNIPESTSSNKPAYVGKTIGKKTPLNVKKDAYEDKYSLLQHSRL